jgi:hypothetical protein
MKGVGLLLSTYLIGIASPRESFTVEKIKDVAITRADPVTPDTLHYFPPLLETGW